MAYVYLLFAILLEVLGTSILRSTEGFTRPVPTAGCLGSYALSFCFLSRVVQELPVGIVYAMWSGLGTTLVIVISVSLLGDRLTWQIAAGVGLIITGVLLLHLSTSHS